MCRVQYSKYCSFRLGPVLYCAVCGARAAQSTTCALRSTHDLSSHSHLASGVCLGFYRICRSSKFSCVYYSWIARLLRDCESGLLAHYLYITLLDMSGTSLVLQNKWTSQVYLSDWHWHVRETSRVEMKAPPSPWVPFSTPTVYPHSYCILHYNTAVFRMICSINIFVAIYNSGTVE